MPSQTEIRKQITNQIIEALEKDLLPWRRPWKYNAGQGRPFNVQSGKPYSGVNPILLQMHAMKHGLGTGAWATFKQWQDLGCRVKKRPDHVKSGEWGAKIVFCKPVTKTVEDERTGEERDETFFILRCYSVFNAEQVEGPAAEKYGPVDEPEWEEREDDPAQALLAATGADIRYTGNRACYYHPVPELSWPNHENGDFIQLPQPSQFSSRDAWLETAYHELAHWSEVRLNWKASYAMNELVAEIAACYVAAELGVVQGETLENHTSYVKNWLEALKNDPSFIFKASTQASKVADFLLAFARQAEEVPATEEELVPF